MSRGTFLFMLGTIVKGAVAALWLIAPGRGLAAEAPVALPQLGAPRGHLTSKAPAVVLYREQPAASDAEPSSPRYGVSMGVAPCDQVVDGRAGQRFYVGSLDYLDSSKFQLTEQRGALTIQVAPRSPGLVRGGFFLL